MVVDCASFDALRSQTEKDILERLAKDDLDLTNRVTLIQVVAGGTYGTVWRGTMGLGETSILVAVKILRAVSVSGVLVSEERKNYKLHQRLYREISTWRHLRHQNVAVLYGFILPEDNNPALVSQWYPNGDVVRYLEVNPSTDRPRLLLQCARGLEYIHAENLVHGDIKGDNVLIDEDSNCRLCDFGMSKFTDSKHVSGVSSSKTPIGTLRFCCPERLEDRPLSEKGDIWAFGCMALQIMLGTYPYPELESVPSIVTAIVSAVPPIPEVISVKTIAEDELWKALRRCCSYDPESRPTMEETACYIADLFPRSVSTASDNVTEGMVTSEIVHSTKLLQEYPEKSSHTQKRRLSSAENQASTTQLDDKLLMESSLRPKQRRRIYEESQNEYDSETELSQLPHANAEFNSASRSLSPTCLTGTRIELLQTIEEWVNANDPSTPSIFWLPGLAGTGKSTVAQTVATALHAKHRLGASFFFSRAEVDRNDPLLVIPSITYQLAHFNPVFRQHISRCLRTEPDAPRSAVKTQIDKLIVGPLQHVKGTLPPVIVVVDALDECADEDMADEMVKLLATAVEKIPFRLKFFITSRPNDHLRRVFNSPLLIPRTLIFTLHEITEEIIRRDIELFIRHGLQEIKEKMLEDEDWPSEEEVQGLVNKSGGLFLFASTSLKFIGDKYHRDPQGRLEIILSSSPGPGSSTTNSVYADIDNLYLQVLHNATPLDHYDKMCERFRNVVGTLILLRDPLPSEVLAALIGTRNATVQAAVALLRSIISVPSSKRPLHVLHQSFPEFLTQRARCSDDRFFINSLQHHGRLALLCLDHINTFLSRDMCEIEDSSLLNSEVVELETRREATIFQHFQYACRHWAFHLCRASFTQDLQRSLKGFCETKLLNWIEALSLFGWMDLARSALEDAINWFQSNKDVLDKPTAALLQDCRQFVLFFHKPLRLSALQTYNSALLFTPECSLYAAYKDELNASPRIINNRQKSWNPCQMVIAELSVGVQCLACSVNGRKIATGSEDRIVRLWDTQTANLIHTLEGHTDDIFSVAFTQDSAIVLSGSADSTVRLWDVVTGTLIRLFETHSTEVHAVNFSKDGSLVVFGAMEPYLQLWDTRTGAALEIPETEDRERANISAIAISPNNSRIAVGTQEGTIKLWDTTATSPFREIEGHEDVVSSIAFSPCGTYLASASWDTFLHLWNVEMGTMEYGINNEGDFIVSLAFSPNGDRLAYGSADNSIRIWDMDSRETIYIMQGHLRHPVTLSFLPNQIGHVLSGSNDGKVQLWDFAYAPNPSDADIGDNVGGVTSVTFSPDGSQVASTGGDMLIHVWDTSTVRPIHILEGHEADPDTVVFSPDSQYLISCGAHCEAVLVWSAVDGSLVGPLNDDNMPGAHCLAFSSSGDVVATGSAFPDFNVRIWNFSDRSVIHVMKGHTVNVTCLSFSQDDSRLVSGSDDNDIRVWDVVSGGLIYVLEGHSGLISSVAFSPDGALIASGSFDKTARLWDAKSGSLNHLLGGHTFVLDHVIFSADGRRLVTDSPDDPSNGLRLWDTSTGKSISNYDGNEPVKWTLSPLLPNFHLAFEGHWIVYFDPSSVKRRLCYVPYTPATSAERAFHGFKVAFGTDTGNVMVIDFSSVFSKEISRLEAAH